MARLIGLGSARRVPHRRRARDLCPLDVQPAALQSWAPPVLDCRSLPQNLSLLVLGQHSTAPGWSLHAVVSTCSCAPKGNTS